jgi:hypothetical protein
MKKLVGFLVGLFLVLGSLGIAVAQNQQQGMSQPPKVIVIGREYLKPGKAGMPHEKTESAFVQAFTRAKWPTHYIAMDSLSGKTRSLFITPYDSFEAWEKDSLAIQKNTALFAALDHASVADGELLASTDQGVFVFNEEYSLHPAVDMPHMRYFEIQVFHIRPGRDKEFDDAFKMVKAAYEKAVPDIHWAVFQEVLGGGVLGGGGVTYVMFTPMRSAAGMDRDLMEGKQVIAAIGEEGMKRLAELLAAGLESSETNLFMFNPKMSYVPDAWVKADPDFWKPKPAPASDAAPKKAAEKPAATQ